MSARIRLFSSVLPSVFACALALSGCGSDASSAPGSGALSGACQPGEEFACACSNGTQAVQHCSEDGTALLPCECGDNANSSGTGGTVATGGVSGTGGTLSTGGTSGGVGGQLPTGGVGGEGGVGAGGGFPTGGDSGGGAGGAGGIIETGGSGGSATGGSGGGTGGPVLPTPTAACPDFNAGTLTFTVDGTPRSALIHIDPGAAATLDGPVVFYWYGTGGQPSQATSGVGLDGIARITAAGGIVVAPTHINTGVFPWIGGGEVDFRLMDEVVGCAEEKIGIDETHIHSLGYSAGALFTAQVSFSRQAYVASVATYSGGGAGIMTQPSNKFSAMIMYGGSGDMVVVNFQQQSQAYYDQLKAAGHFAPICNHNSGHVIPAAAVPSVIQFFFDHPFNVPSPYASGFPVGFPSYCVP